ncbi:MAG: hypothetical protein AAGH78_16475, partial [Cyanobacteria bacterium P01_H01_bin.58]
MDVATNLKDEIILRIGVRHQELRASFFWMLNSFFSSPPSPGLSSTLDALISPLAEHIKLTEWNKFDSHWPVVHMNQKQE